LGQSSAAAVSVGLPWRDVDGGGRRRTEHGTSCLGRRPVRPAVGEQQRVPRCLGRRPVRPAVGEQQVVLRLVELRVVDPRTREPINSR
jgi:hypothetical protein